VTFELRECVEIDAPLARVWDVVVDLERYDEWNPFCVAAKSTLEVGSPIHMKVRLIPGITQPQTETVLEHIPRERFGYGLPGSFFGAMKSRRFHIVEAIDEVRTRYTSDFRMEGWLSGLVVLLLGGRLRAGFAANTASLKVRAEDLDLKSR
jgi:hypothetical protein